MFPDQRILWFLEVFQKFPSGGLKFLRSDHPVATQPSDGYENIFESSTSWNWDVVKCHRWKQWLQWKLVLLVFKNYSWNPAASESFWGRFDRIKVISFRFYQSWTFCNNIWWNRDDDVAARLSAWTILKTSRVRAKHCILEFVLSIDFIARSGKLSHEVVGSRPVSAILPAKPKQYLGLHPVRLCSFSDLFQSKGLWHSVDTPNRIILDQGSMDWPGYW